MDKFVIFVNTCDKFEDCWNPFFKLFSLYWPHYKGKIYLNTEYKDYSYPGLDIIPVKGCEIFKDAHQITWSECLKRGLSAIDHDVILYMQEDYFLKNPVADKIIEEYAELINTGDADCIHLTDQNTHGPFIKSSPYRGLWTLAQNCDSRISCQAALWNKGTLSSYIRTYESAWNFEEFGTKRAEVLHDKFYTVDRTMVKINESEIIPYVFTGIIKGKWFEEVIPLFKAHDIDIDYSIRGLTIKTPPKTIYDRIRDRMKKMPNYLRNQLELRNLRHARSSGKL